MTNDEDRPDDHPPDPTVPYRSDGPGRDSDSRHGRFLPGTLFGKRYRIVGLLGRGGMGEVYQADDLVLGQSVALKFLPQDRVTDPEALERLRREVRAARQVSHPNVCRVYDIGEIDGLPYLSMEYVDGEDLASLLRRVGRPSQDKALQIARQLCAGLAAAHECGVLHRDLKPANVMIDGRGRARIMDFGLAGLAADPRGQADMAGTPAYMSPEQMAGRHCTVQSDIHALGLVLYEVFTGKRAYQADSFAELRRLVETSTPSQPSCLVQNLDPATERAILRCLEPDPAERPVAVHTVAAALPGGDPLAAAIAAGETPSPEMVAASGGRGGLPSHVVGMLLAAIVGGMLLVAYLGQWATLHHLDPIEKPPAVLADRARAILAQIGYSDPPVDVAYGFEENESYLRHLLHEVPSTIRWQRPGEGHPPAYLFWYRESPTSLISVDQNPLGNINRADPPPLIGGEACLVLDGSGRLQWLDIIPPQISDTLQVAGRVDWSELFAVAGLDLERFEKTRPVWNPLHHVDDLVGWEGHHPELPERHLRIVGGSWRGRPVFFRILDTFTLPERMPEMESASVPYRIVWYLITGLWLAGMILAFVFARRNLRSGRGDSRGALRLGIFAFASIVVMWLCGAHRVVRSIVAFYPLTTVIGYSLFFSMCFGLGYLALEPAARKRWPGMLISWSRLLQGRLRDSRVGRDVLYGLLAGVVTALLWLLAFLVPTWLGMNSPSPVNASIYVLGGSGECISQFLFTGYLWQGLFFLFLLLLLRLLLRRSWLMALGFVMLVTGFMGSLYINYDFSLWGFVLDGVLLAILVYVVLTRLGLLTVMSQFFVADILRNFPFTLDTSAWYAHVSTLTLLALGAIAGYAAHIAMSGQPRSGKQLET